MRNIVLFAGLAFALASRADRTVLPDLAVPGAMGVNIHFTDPKPGEVKMIADAGFKWVRMDFAWGGTERERGTYDFGAYDRLLAALQPHGIRAYFILDYGNRLYDAGFSPHTEEGRAAMAKWAAAAATHFKGRGVVWEAWNEPNIAQFWKPKPNAEDYAKLALAVAKAIRSAARDELLVGPATSTIDLPFLETCFDAGLLDYWDAVSVHPYRQGDPETVSAEYRKLRLLIARHAPAGKTIPVVSGEWGYSSAWANHDEARQARYLPREMLVNLYNEVPVGIWYDWHDDGRDAKEAEHHFGTVRNEYKKDAEPVYEAKPAYAAMRTMAEQLGGFAYNKRLALDGDDDYCLLFASGDDVRLACWSTRPPHDVSLPVGAGKFEMVTAGTAPTAASAGPGGLTVALTDTVTYVRPVARSEFLRVAAACERVPLEIVRPAGKLARKFSVRNPLGRPLTAAINGWDDVTVAPGGSAGFEVGMTIGRSAAPKALTITTRLPGLGTFAQVTSAISSDPLDATLLPAVSDGATSKLPLIVVRVDNPSRRAADLVVRVRTVKGLYWPEASKDVTIPAGADHAYVALEMGCPAAPSYVASLALLDAADRVLLELPKRAYHTVVNVGEIGEGKLAEHVATVADGDRAVKAEHALTLAPSPSPSEKEPNPDYIPTPALKLKYAFDPGWKFLQVKPVAAEMKKIDGKPKLLGLWVRGDGSGSQLRLRFTDAAGQTFQPGGVKIDFNGWRYVTIPMDGTEAGHWGKGDGRVNYPIAWDALLLIDNASRDRRAGELWFAGMTLIE